MWRAGRRIGAPPPRCGSFGGGDVGRIRAHAAELVAVPTANLKRLTAAANRLILVPDERSLQIDLVRNTPRAETNSDAERPDCVAGVGGLELGNVGFL